MPRLQKVEPLEHESISHYLGRLRRCKGNSLPSAYALGQAAGIGSVISRWEKLYFNPFPTDKELAAIAHLIGLSLDRLKAMLPTPGITTQPRPIRLCAACYAVSPCHRMEWQHKAVEAFCKTHQIRLLERCPSCKTAFPVPVEWKDSRCHHCGMRFQSMVKYQARMKNVS
jgi:hypothetical protein